MTQSTMQNQVTELAARRSRLTALWLAGCLFTVALGVADHSGVMAHWPVAQVWLDLAFAQAAAGVLICMMIALGALLLRSPWLRDCELSPAGRLACSFGLGMQGAHLLLLILALASLLNRLGLGALLLAGVGLTAWLLQTRPDVPQAARSLAAAGASRHKLLLILAIAAWLTPFWLQTLLPHTDYDSVSHHLPVAKRFLEVGVWHLDLAYEPFAYPGAAHLVYSVLVAFNADMGVNLLNLFASLMVIVGVYAVAVDLAGPRAAVLAALVAASTNLLMELGLDARIDSFLALGSLLACWGVLQWTKSGQRGWLLLAGAMLGWTLGLKYTAGALLLVLGAIVLAAAAWQMRRRPAQTIGPLAAALVLVALPSLFWYARNHVEAGSALYAFHKGPVYRSNTGELTGYYRGLAPLVKQLPVPPEYQVAVAENAEPSAAGSGPRRHLYNWWLMLVQPEHYIRKPYHWLSPFLLAGVLLPVMDRRKTAWLLWGMTVALYLILAARVSLLRYLLPVTPLLAVAAGLVLARPSGRRWAQLVVLALSLLLLFNWGVELNKLRLIRPQDYWLAKYDALKWASVVGYNNDTVTPATFVVINNRVARGDMSHDDTIFMVGEARGFALDCHYLPDVTFGLRWTTQLINAGGDYDQLTRSLGEQGIRYVYFNQPAAGLKMRENPRNAPRVRFVVYHFYRWATQLLEAGEARVILKSAHNHLLLDLGPPAGSDVPSRNRGQP